MISLGGGLPSPEYFPFEHLDIKVPTPPGFSPEATRQSGTTLRAGKQDIKDGSSLYGALRLLPLGFVFYAVLTKSPQTWRLR